MRRPSIIFFSECLSRPRLKDLTSVKFTYHTEGKEGATGSKDPGEAVCPSCMKKLSNNVIMFCGSLLHFHLPSKPLIDVPVMKPCSHVVCRTCTETLVRPETAASKSSSAPKDEGASRKEETHVCVVCDVRLKKKDIIELKREGGLCILFSSSFIIDLLQQARASQAGAWQKPVVAEFPSRVEFEQAPRRVFAEYLQFGTCMCGSIRVGQIS